MTRIPSVICVSIEGGPDTRGPEKDSASGRLSYSSSGSERSWLRYSSTFRCTMDVGSCNLKPKTRGMNGRGSSGGINAGYVCKKMWGNDGPNIAPSASFFLDFET